MKHVSANAELKPAFKERMRLLLAEDFDDFEKIIKNPPRGFIRCNTLKISTEDLVKRLEKRWKVSQPFKKYPELVLVESELAPGELGNSPEHLWGYYYIQEVSSMMPVIALNPEPNELILDLCASPGSKTTQMAAAMGNKGTVVANEINFGRMKVLCANLERCGVSNAIVTRNDAVGLCERLAKNGFKFDKILLDAPCSGEGTLRSSLAAYTRWNLKVVQGLSRMQKKLLAYALKCLKKGGQIIYSTCTHSPEENEGVVDFALKNFPVKIEEVNLPLKFRSGITSWEGNSFNEEVKKCCRIYPQDGDSEGFFVSKMTLLEEIK